jgi:hypothetical protein
MISQISACPQKIIPVVYKIPPRQRMPPHDNPSLREMHALLREMKAMNTPFDHTELGAMGYWNKAAASFGVGKVGTATKNWDKLSAQKRKDVMTGVVNFMQTWISNCEVSEINDLKKAFDKNPEIHTKWVAIDSKKNNHVLFEKQTYDQKKQVMIEVINHLITWINALDVTNQADNEKVNSFNLLMSD